jgi:hypothetical protein
MHDDRLLDGASRSASRAGEKPTLLNGHPSISSRLAAGSTRKSRPAGRHQAASNRHRRYHHDRPGGRRVPSPAVIQPFAAARLCLRCRLLLRARCGFGTARARGVRHATILATRRARRPRRRRWRVAGRDPARAPRTSSGFGIDVPDDDARAVRALGLASTRDGRVPS